MKTPPVHILITCRKPELLRASTMVFDTLRVGFPTAEVIAHWNTTQPMPNPTCIAIIEEALSKAGVKTAPHVFPVWQDEIVAKEIHHTWIETLLRKEPEPFYILDTDVVFWSQVEHWDFQGKAMAGRFIPRFFDQFTKCVTQPRLHTSLLYLDPVLIRHQIAEYLKRFPSTPFNPEPNWIYPCWQPVFGQEPIFNDTCSLLYQAIHPHTRAFGSEHLDCYDHLNFGTISDLIAPHYPHEHWREQHFAVFENPGLLRGAWRQQDNFYERHAC